MAELNQKNSKILLVDDFEIVRLMLKSALTELGFADLDEAADGKEAMKKLTDAHKAGKPFSLVFCDWNMPEMSGIEVLEACRKSAEFAQLPIVMVTAEAEQGSVVRAIRAGANDYIVKPTAPEILERKIQRIMSKLTGNAA